MTKNKTFIIIAVIVTIVVGGVYMVIGTKDPEARLEQLYNERNAAKTFEEVIKIEKKINALKKKIDPKWEESPFQKMKEAENEAPPFKMVPLGSIL